MLLFREICRRTQAELTWDFHLVIQQTLTAHLLWARCPVGKKISPVPASKKWKGEAINKSKTRVIYGGYHHRTKCSTVLECCQGNLWKDILGESWAAFITQQWMRFVIILTRIRECLKQAYSTKTQCTHTEPKRAYSMFEYWDTDFFSCFFLLFWIFFFLLSTPMNLTDCSAVQSCILSLFLFFLLGTQLPKLLCFLSDNCMLRFTTKSFQYSWDYANEVT